MTGRLFRAALNLSTDNQTTSWTGGPTPRRQLLCWRASNENTIAGYYTLSATAVVFDQLPEDFRKKLPRYPEVPAALVGRLAVDTRHRDKRLGELLLFDAMRRTLQADLAAAILVVDAKDDAAAEFYRSYDFLDIGPARSAPLFTYLRNRQNLPGKMTDMKRRLGRRDARRFISSSYFCRNAAQPRK